MLPYFGQGAQLYIVLQIVLLLLTGSQSPRSTPVESLADYCDQHVPGWLEYYKIPGATLALIHESEIVWTRAYGLADRETGRPMTTDTVFQVASISKSVTAWAVLRLAEQGDVDLDTPVGQYLTRWQLPLSEYDPDEVTVRRLLSHSAGLPSVVYTDILPDEPVPPLEIMLNGSGHPDEAARIVHPPGEQFVYSNPGYGVLELMIEEVTGQTFADYLDAAILEPLGMTSSSFDPDADLLARAATGYYFDGQPAPQTPQLLRAAGGLYAPVGDLARFVVAAMSSPAGAPPGRRVIEPESVALMHTPVIRTQGMTGFVSESYGLGHFLETLPTGEQAISHGGENAGWLLYYYAVPEAGEGLVVLTNSERSMHFNARIIGVWARWCGFHSTQMSRTFSMLAAVVRWLIILIGGWVLWLAWRLGQGLLVGKRRLAPFARQAWRIRLLQVIGAGLLAVARSRVGQSIVLPLLPVLGQWLIAAALGCAVLLLLSALFPFH